jgi:ubiquitin-conjugating enzyme E2 S
MDGPADTPYEGRCFALKLVFGRDYPATPPRAFFLTKIYHPNVDMSTGAVCVNVLKKDWQPAVMNVQHICTVIRCLLIVPYPESSLNDEAGKLFMSSYQEYYRRAKILTEVHGKHQSDQGEPDQKKPSNTSSKRASPSSGLRQDAEISTSPFASGKRSPSPSDDDCGPLRASSPVEPLRSSTSDLNSGAVNNLRLHHSSSRNGGASVLVATSSSGVFNSDDGENDDSSLSNKNTKKVGSDEGNSFTKPTQLGASDAVGPAGAQKKKKTSGTSASTANIGSALAAKKKSLKRL